MSATNNYNPKTGSNNASSTLVQPNVTGVLYKTVDFTFTSKNTQGLIVMNAGSTVDVHLPPATGTGKFIEVVNIGNDKIIVNAYAGDTIFTETTIDVIQYEAIRVRDYQLTKWVIV